MVRSLTVAVRMGRFLTVSVRMGRSLTVAVRIERGVALPVGSRLNVVVFVMALAFRFYFSFHVYFDDGIGGSRENGRFFSLRCEVV